MNAESNHSLLNLRRLGISHVVEEIPTLEEHKCLRSLLLFNNKNFKSVHKDTFRKLEHIRVLVLSGTSIQNIPESVGNLVLLRLLDLSFTEINKLPESTGSLISLEYLSLRGCCWGTRYATLAQNKIFYRFRPDQCCRQWITRLPLDAQTRSGSRVDVARRCRVVEQPAPPRRSHEQFVQAPQVQRLRGIHTYREELRAADC